MAEQFILEKEDIGVSTLIVQEARDDDNDVDADMGADVNFDPNLACSSFIRLSCNSFVSFL